MSSSLPLVVLVSALGFFVYTYAGYPALLWVLARIRPRPIRTTEVEEWPHVSVTVPAYNEEGQIEDLIHSLLALDYPPARLQVLIVSDASSDRTDEIVKSYADRGVELLRMPERGGKTKAETAAAEHLRGDIVVNTDASIRIAPASLKALMRTFADPEVGLASGRDVSIGKGQTAANVGESGYVGYEMAIRDMETMVGGIIGASGCFYAIRPDLHRLPLPDALSRDFAAALHTLEHGYRAVSVPEAICHVPRTTSLKREYSRKVRTITRGMQTLWHKRALMNPFRTGKYAWMLVSHKVCRWALPWAALAGFLGVAALAQESLVMLAILGVGVVGLTLAALGWMAANRPHLPRILSIPAFLVGGNVAAAHAFLRAISGDEDPTWEPTRR